MLKREGALIVPFLLILLFNIIYIIGIRVAQLIGYQLIEL